MTTGISSMVMDAIRTVSSKKDGIAPMVTELEKTIVGT